MNCDAQGVHQAKDRRPDEHRERVVPVRSALTAGGDPHFVCDVVADGDLLLLSVLVLLATL